MESLMELKGKDKLERLLDEKIRFFYPGAKILWNIAGLIMGFKTKGYTYYAIGQSHLDACWLWRRKQTLQKNYITFTKALKHMRDYPFFTFSNTSPCYYHWMEKLTPDIFNEVKKRVKEGRFELIGGMWVDDTS